MRMLILLALSAVLSAQAHAQPVDDPNDAPPRRARRGLQPGQPSSGFLKNVRDLMDGFRSMGPWDEHYGYIMDATEKVYDNNGWVSESDQFSLEMIRNVAAIPPWQMRDRFDTMIGMLGERYALDEEQEQRLRVTVAREANGVFQRNAPRIMQYALDAIRTRTAGEPFTPEKVAQWAKLARPVFDDSRSKFEAAAEEFIATLRPDQQELARRDLDAGRARADTVEAMTDRWMRGGWEASDWGLDTDPIQMAGEQRLAELRAVAEERATAEAAAAKPATAAPVTRTPTAPRPGASTPRSPRPEDRARLTPTPGARHPVPVPPPAAETAKPAPEKEGPWAKYVREFIAKFKLNKDQEATAWRLHHAMESRADQVRKRYGLQIDNVKSRMSKDSEAMAKEVKKLEDHQTAAVDKIFEQLKSRLDRIPTRAQREAAKD